MGFTYVKIAHVDLNCEIEYQVYLNLHFYMSKYWTIHIPYKKILIISRSINIEDMILKPLPIKRLTYTRASLAKKVCYTFTPFLCA